MKIASVSVVAQHPKGLGMHVRNLRWALEGTDYQIYIFTHKKWCFDKKAYPDVIFVEVDGDDPMKYHHYWRWEIPTTICKDINADLLLFTEQDIFYTVKLKEQCNEVLKHNKIIISDTMYYQPLFSGYVEIYPRIWEGGCIMPTWRIKKALLEDNITISNQILSCDIVEWCKQQPKDMVMHGRKLSKLNIGTYVDTMYEFTIYCYLNKAPIHQASICTHFFPVDRAHRLYPEIYNADLTNEQIKSMSIPGISVQCCLFLFYVSGAIKANDALYNCIKYPSMHFKDQLSKLMVLAKEWMTSEEHERAQELQAISLIPNIKIL